MACAKAGGQRPRQLQETESYPVFPELKVEVGQPEMKQQDQQGSVHGGSYELC